MPFGLTNAPSTFYSFMNDVLRAYLRKCVLVFFDDILIYNPCLAAHLQHLEWVFQTLQKNSLVVKESKCSFGASQVEYLGHIISGKGVAVDPSKIECVEKWPLPKTIKALRGFLGLAGYYRKYVKGFGLIAKPLTSLLKKDGFKWDERSTEAFEELKAALTSTPVLAFSDFSKPFTIECDASEVGIGAVLSQDRHLIAFMSKALSQRHLALSVYDKEMLAVGCKDVKQFVANCDVCQQNHYEAIRPPGLLQPINIPDKAWSVITMDFIEGLPKSQGKTVIWVVVDKLTKVAHFILLSHPYTAASLANVFVSEVFRLHGMPDAIISDRDPIFMSLFLEEFFKLQGTSLNKSTAYHPQTDGQTENLNQTLEQYLHCVTGNKPQEWELEFGLAHQELLAFLAPASNAERGRPEPESAVLLHSSSGSSRLESDFLATSPPHMRVCNILTQVLKE
ncbi:PREDICTED: genome polyprotein-like [Fragaria vesca subsp. vesca]